MHPIRLALNAAFIMSLAMPASGAEGAGVLELFSSEGCSSCPPAEIVANALERDALARHENLNVLVFPVDYWDSLGWKDPFASPDFTARQADYARALGLRQVFTPQAIVNGAVSLVGAQEHALRQALERARGQALPTQVTLSARWRDGRCHPSVLLSGAPAGAEVAIALTERGLVSAVAAGENAGRTLVHAPIVRAFQVVSAGARLDDLVLTPPAGLVHERSGITVLVQDVVTRRVLGVGSTHISE
jgi:hypothetical protein